MSFSIGFILTIEWLLWCCFSISKGILCMYICLELFKLLYSYSISLIEIIRVLKRPPTRLFPSCVSTGDDV